MNNTTDIISSSERIRGFSTERFSIKYYKRAPNPRVDDAVAKTLDRLNDMGFSIRRSPKIFNQTSTDKTAERILREDIKNKEDIISKFTDYSVEELLQPNGECYLEGSIRIKDNYSGVISYLPYLNVYSLPADAVEQLTGHLAEVGAFASIISLTLTLSKLIKDRLTESYPNYNSKILAITYGHLSRNQNKQGEEYLLRQLQSKHDVETLLFTGWGWGHVSEFSKKARFNAIITEGCILRLLENGRSIVRKPLYTNEDLQLVKSKLFDTVGELLSYNDTLYLFPQNNEAGVSMFINPNQKVISNLNDYGFMENNPDYDKLVDELELSIQDIHHEQDIAIPHGQKELYNLVQTCGQIATFCPISVATNGDKFEVNLKPDYYPDVDKLSRKEIKKSLTKVNNQNIVLQEYSVDIFLKRKHDIIERVFDSLSLEYPLSLTYVSKNTEADLPLFRRLSSFEEKKPGFNFSLIGTKETISGELTEMFPKLMFTHHTEATEILRFIDNEFNFIF